METESLPLRDIHLPDPVGWWPPAPGWWGLLVLIPALIGATIWFIRRRRRITPIMLALRELDFLQNEPRLSPDDKLRRLSALLRQTCLTLYPREQVAGLVGEDWLRRLDEALGEPRFSQGPGRLLIEAQYRPAPPQELSALLALARDWLLALSRTPGGKRAL